MSFNPMIILEWINAIRALIELLKELFPDDKATQNSIAKAIIEASTKEA